jgi:hypothetical protein
MAKLAASHKGSSQIFVPVLGVAATLAFALASLLTVMWPFRKKPEDLEPDEKPLLERVFTQSPALAQAYKLREELTALWELP